jgi:hypothetical protein
MRDEYVLTHPVAGRARIVENRIAVRWREDTPAEERAAVLERNGLEPIALSAGEAARIVADVSGAGREAAPVPAARPPGFETNQSAGLSMVEARPGVLHSAEVAERLEAEPPVMWISPVFQAEGTTGPQSQFAVNPGRLYVAPSVAAVLDGAEDAPVRFKVDAARTAALHSRQVCLVIDRPSFARGQSSMDLADWLAERSRASLAPPPSAAGEVQFETIPLLSPALCGCGGETRAAAAASAAAPFIPNDPLFSQAWGLARVQAPEGWSVTQGCPEVVVAVIDQGVDLGHPDIALHPQSWNASTDTPNGGPVGPHGTCCAGIVAARGNNALGGIGVAPRCRIMAIATSTWADMDIAEGLYFAADHGARVVSMSFGAYPAWNIWNFAPIRDALQYAHDRGLVLVAAAGNENIPVSRFPGSDARTLCVGGSNRADERKRTGDTSSEPFWGACYGPDLDVLAPCLEIPTTDIRGAAGYTSTDYQPAFDGTSAATPHVAGLAGLLLCLCPELTNVDVRHLIESTCDKISPALYPYANVGTKPSGTWHSETGYGRINVKSALEAATRQCPTRDECCDGPHVCLEPTPEACRAPEAPPWLPFDHCMYWYEPVIVRCPSRAGLLVRVMYEHCVCAKGRQQGPLLYSTTLLPGETIRLYHYERFRRVHSDTERVTVSSSFRQSVSTLSATRSLVVEDLSQRSSVSGGASSGISASTGLIGKLFGGGSASAGASVQTSSESSLSVHNVAEAFQQVATAASQQVDAERSVVVSNYEDAEVRDVTERTIANLNHCFAVTYYARRVMEVYSVCTRVTQVDWATVAAEPVGRLRFVLAAPPSPPVWRPLEKLDIGNDRATAEWVGRVPRVADMAESPHEVMLPTDGVLYETELAHCSSCEPARGMEVLIGIERAQCEARRLCLETELMELEVERRRALLASGVLAPFGG